MRDCTPSPTSPGDSQAGAPVLQMPEAYVLALISEGRLEAALEAIDELGGAELYWPDFHNAAQRLMRAGRLEAAANAASAAVALDARRAQGHEVLGEIRLRQRNWGAAEKCFRAALEHDPRSASARFGLGRALRQQGKRSQALEALVAALESDPRPEWLPELQATLRRARPGKPRRGLASSPERRRASPDLPTISVCMIVRDEEDTLARCLASVRRVADEIVVVDTGSQDATVAIAQRYAGTRLGLVSGATPAARCAAAERGEAASGVAAVHHFTWCDDFSAARNESLRHATCDWVLVVDADDELGDPAGLKEYLACAGRIATPDAASPRQEVKVCSMRTRIPHRGQAGETIVEHPRLFRNHLGFHYRGPVHEQLCSASGDPATADAALDLWVYHHGYLEDEAEQAKRGERNLRILRAWVARNPQDAWAQFCLAQTYYTEREMEQAVAPLMLTLEHAAPDRAYRGKAYAYLASAQTAIGEADRAERTCRAGLEEFPDQAELLFCLGHALECQKREQEAIAAYEAATRGRFGPMLAFHDFTCRDVKPLARLAEIHAGRGRLEEAERCIERMERVRGRLPVTEVLRARIEAARRLRREPASGVDAALESARAAVEANPDDAGARVRLAALLTGRGNSAGAEEQATAALGIDPACAEALNLKGILLCAQGRHTAAAEHFQRAAAVRPGYADALANLGAARLQLNDVAGAESAFREAAQADASCFAAHLALAEIARSHHDNQSAIAAYEAAIGADESEAAPWLGLARCYLESGAYEPAARCYARAVEMAGPDPAIMAEVEQVRRRLAKLGGTPRRRQAANL